MRVAPYAGTNYAKAKAARMWISSVRVAVNLYGFGRNRGFLRGCRNVCADIEIREEDQTAKQRQVEIA